MESYFLISWVSDQYATPPGPRPAGGAAARRPGQVLRSVAEVLADRAYTTAKPEHWARPLRTMGIVETKDLHETQRGVRPGPVPDTIWLDGRLHSAAIPTDLRELDPPRPADSATTKARRREEFDRRRKYEFVGHSSAAADARQQGCSPPSRCWA